MNNNCRVAVSGMGCLSALGLNVDTCMKNMFDGMRNINVPKRFTTTHAIKYPVLEIRQSFKQPEFERNQDLTLTAQMAISVAYQALEDAGIIKTLLEGKTVGVCMGTTVGCALNNDQFYIDYRNEKQPGMDPIKRYLKSNPAAAIAREFNLTGPVQTIVNACASGTDAIGMGASWIKAGLCDLVIAGGTDELCKTTYNGFVSLQITDDAPCKPFDLNRKGLNLGEGAAAVILEPCLNNQTLKNDPKGFIAGYGSACDAYHLTGPHPEGIGLKNAITQALGENNISPAAIGFVNAHGTGTRENDKVEDRVLSQLLPGTPFFSTKGYTGHTLGAAGAIEAVFTIWHLNFKKIPKSIGFSLPDTSMTQSPIVEAMGIDSRFAMSESVAFGGNNSVLIVCETENFES
jgi:3-oxoacyl-(acyl-carrier-protein) synthase